VDGQRLNTASPEKNLANNFDPTVLQEGLWVAMNGQEYQMKAHAVSIGRKKKNGSQVENTPWPMSGSYCLVDLAR